METDANIIYDCNVNYNKSSDHKEQEDNLDYCSNTLQLNSDENENKDVTNENDTDGQQMLKQHAFFKVC